MASNKNKVIEIHSGLPGAESDINIERLLSVEQPSSTVEVVVIVNMLKKVGTLKTLHDHPASGVYQRNYNGANNRPRVAFAVGTSYRRILTLTRLKLFRMIIMRVLIEKAQ